MTVIHKRKAFIIKGNFQLKFAIAFVLLLITAISISTFFIYESLEIIVEKVVFSSHFSLESSGELFWQKILKINIIATSIGIFIGLIVILCIHFYLNNLFSSLASALKGWGSSNFTPSLSEKGSLPGVKLIKETNEVACILKARAEKIESLLDNAIKLINNWTSENNSHFEDNSNIKEDKDEIKNNSQYSCNNAKEFINKEKAIHSELLSIKCP